MNRNFDLELRIIPTNDIYFKLNTGINLIPNEIFNIRLYCENKIISEFDTLLELKRESSSYKFEALYNAKDSHYKAYMDILPENENFKSTILIEKSDVKLVEGTMSLIKDLQNGYKVNLEIESNKYGKLNAQGGLMASLLRSNVHVSFDYAYKSFSLPTSELKIEHSFDLDNKEKSKAIVELDVPFFKINHALRVFFKLDDKLSFDNLELQLETPSSHAKPYTLFYEKNIMDSDDLSELIYKAGLKNFNLNLPEILTTHLAQYMIEIDDDLSLGSFDGLFKKSYNKKLNQIGLDFKLNKNKHSFVDLSGLVDYDNEIRSDIRVKYLKNSASLKAKMGVRRSADDEKNYYANYVLESENPMLIKYFTLLKVDLNSLVKKGSNQWSVNVNYGGKTENKNALLTLQTDCASGGACNFYKLNYDTDSEILGVNFRHLDVNYLNVFKANEFNEISFDFGYRRASQDSITKTSLVFDTDCLTGACSSAKLDYTTDCHHLAAYLRSYNLDYTMKNENNLNEKQLLMVYKRGSDSEAKKAKLTFSTDCSTGLCKSYVLKYKTDNEYFGYFVRVLNLSYKIKNEKDINEMKIDVDYQLASETSESNTNIVVRSDCSPKGKCNYYKISYDTNSEVLGRNFRQFNFDYKATHENNFSSVDMDVDYRKANQEKARSAKLAIRTDCITGKHT